MHLINKSLLLLFIIFYSNSAISSELENLINQADKNNNLEWNSYLKKISHFNNKEHLYVIRKLAREYNKAINELNSCSQKSSEQFYPAKCFNELTQKFSQKQISDNFNLIKDTIYYLGTKYRIDFCREYEKNVLFQELILKKAIESYVDRYLSYYRTLSISKKSVLKNEMEIIERLSKVHSLTYQKLIGNNVQISQLPEARYNLNKNKNKNSKIAAFLLNHDQLKKPFDYVKLIEDIRTIKNQ